VKPIFFVIAIGLVFGLVGALMAFLITYGEYSRHFMAKKRALKISLETAFVMLGIFITIALIVAFLLFK
jgi:hypothetical protein